MVSRPIGIKGTFIYFSLMKACKMKKSLQKFGVAALCSVSIAGMTACVYEPEQFEDTSKKTGSSATSDIGTVYAVNAQNQICNPSISQDLENYPEAMLWLNFGGDLNVDPGETDFDAKDADVHDRLTVTDKSSKVLWYLMTDSTATECQQFQDPEWSTHPNFVVALRGYNYLGKKNCDDMDYGIFAARMTDKKLFWFVEKGFGEFGTPHVWVDPSAKPDTAAVDSTVEGFFGTENVRLVYVDPDNDIVFVDYANGGMKKSVKLKKSKEMEDWMVDSPLISPDGNFIVFNTLNSSMNDWKSFVQELTPSSKPVKIELTADMTGEPVQPHWFKYGERLFVTWAEFPAGAQFVSKNDLSSKSVQDGSAGRTAMREISLAAGAPSDLSMQWLGPVTEIAPVPTIGGRSADGKFIATGANYGFMIELP